MFRDISPYIIHRNKIESYFNAFSPIKMHIAYVSDSYDVKIKDIQNNKLFTISDEKLPTRVCLNRGDERDFAICSDEEDTITGTPSTITILSYSDDGRYLAVGSNEGNTVSIYETTTYKFYKKITYGIPYTSHIVFRNENIVVLNGFCKMEMYDMNANLLHIHDFDSSADNCFRIDICKKNNYIIVWCNKNQVNIYCLNTFTLLYKNTLSYLFNCYSIEALCIPDTYLFVVVTKNNIYLHNIQTDTLEMSYDTDLNIIPQALLLSSDKKTLIIGDHYGGHVFFDLDSGNLSRYNTDFKEYNMDSMYFINNDEDILILGFHNTHIIRTSKYFINREMLEYAKGLSDKECLLHNSLESHWLYDKNINGVIKSFL
jgi:WD40 repeat protein